MPQWSAAGAVSLSSGERLAVLNGENLASGAGSQGFVVQAQPVPVSLTIWNNSGESVALQSSPDNTNWLPVTSQGTAVTAATGTAETFQVSSGLYYRVAASADITDGTIWVAR